jgi:hypothetical protein
MTENCDDFGADVEFMFDKKIAAILNKMMIERFRKGAEHHKCLLGLNTP